MTQAFAHVNGERVTHARVIVPNVGPWLAELDFQGDAEISGRVPLVIGTTDSGALSLSGTVEPGSAGAFGAQRKCTLVAGAGAWSRSVAAKDYHNDANVKARNVADDLAREVGESFGAFVPAVERVGRDYVRAQGPASRILEQAIGTAAWWVDFDGVTHVGTRSTVEAARGSFQIIDYDARERVVTLGVTDPRAITVGSVLRDERFEGPLTVRELELRLTPDDLRVVAWCGGTDKSRGQLADLIVSMIEHVAHRRLRGIYRYRVVRMAGDRVELQVVRKVTRLPDVLPVSMFPGVAGIHAVLTPGAEVAVQFMDDGDPTQPIVTHFAGKDGVGFQPVSMVIGGPSGQPAARRDDSVRVTVPANTFLVAAQAGVMNAAPVTLDGQITAGSARVAIA